MTLKPIIQDDVKHRLSGISKEDELFLIQASVASIKRHAVDAKINTAIVNQVNRAIHLSVEEHKKGTQSFENTLNKLSKAADKLCKAADALDNQGKYPTFHDEIKKHQREMNDGMYAEEKDAQIDSLALSSTVGGQSFYGSTEAKQAYFRPRGRPNNAEQVKPSAASASKQKFILSEEKIKLRTLCGQLNSPDTMLIKTSTVAIEDAMATLYHLDETLQNKEVPVDEISSIQSDLDETHVKSMETLIQNCLNDYPDNMRAQAESYFNEIKWLHQNVLSDIREKLEGYTQTPIFR